MKIIHICFSRYGGAGIAAWRLHESLIKSGYDSWFLSADNNESTDSSLNWVVVNETFTFRVIKFLKRRILELKKYYVNQKLRKELFYLRKNRNIEAATLPFSYYDVLNHWLVKQADIINLHWVSKFIDNGSFLDGCKVPIVWTMHDMNPILGVFHYQNEMIKHEKEFYKIDETIKLLKRDIYLKFNHKITVVAPSKWLFDEINKSNLFIKSKIHLIPYSIPLSVYRPLDRYKVRKELNISNDEKVILFIADKLNIYRKGFDLLLEAFDSLKNDKIRLVAIGDSSNNFHVNNKIHYVGHINSPGKLAEYYSCADIFIIPSREENLGNTMLESLSCGTPVIAFKIGGIVDHVIDGFTGYLAKEVSSVALAKAIHNFINEPNAFDRDKIRSYAADKFCEKKQTEAYLKIYLDLIK